MCECMNYESETIIGDGYVFYTYKCNDCGREWFDVFQLNHIETVEGRLENNEDWSY